MLKIKDIKNWEDYTIDTEGKVDGGKIELKKVEY